MSLESRACVVRHLGGRALWRPLGVVPFAVAALLLSSCQKDATARPEPERASNSAPAPASAAAKPGEAPSAVQTGLAKYEPGTAVSAPVRNPPPGETAAADTAAAPAEPLADKAKEKAPAKEDGAGKTAAKDGAQPKQGVVISEEPFSAWLQAPTAIGVGGQTLLEAVLVAKPPFHCNPDYPHKFKLDAAPANLSYPADVVRGMLVTPARGVLAIPVTAKSAGQATVSGTLSFSVCNDERCLVEKRDLALALDVK
jgi:hypothetical protein